MAPSHYALGGAGVKLWLKPVMRTQTSPPAPLVQDGWHTLVAPYCLFKKA